MSIATQLARDILEKDAEIEFLQSRLARLEGVQEKYDALLNDSISHSQHMIDGLFKIAMTPGVLDKLREKEVLP